MEDVQKKLHYITTIDFQIMYSFKISKKREDTIFLRLNYLHCFTKYDKVMALIGDCDGNQTRLVFEKTHFLHVGWAD